MDDEDVHEHETWLMWILKIDELSELMNYGMLACNWLYDYSTDNVIMITGRCICDKHDVCDIMTILVW